MIELQDAESFIRKRIGSKIDLCGRIFALLNFDSRLKNYTLFFKYVVITLLFANKLI